jgi:hypothetical protein
MRTPSSGSPFERAISRLVESYRSGAEMRASAAVAEAILAEGMRLGDDVRRRARGAGGTRPTPDDVAALEVMIGRLEQAVAAARAQPEMAELQRAIAAARGDRSAELAVGLFSDLERIAPPEHAFFPLPVRRHSRDLGETLPEPEALVAEIRALLARGLSPPDAPGGAPEPIVLAPSWDAAGSEVALRLRGGDIAPVVLRHEPSGDLWCFASVLPGPFTVCLARDAEDEWWAASPLPYPRYATAVAERLAAAGIPCERIA